MARLIDANEAIEKINCLCVNGNENWIGTDNQSFVDHADVVDILSDMPTVDAVEVVHGYWIDSHSVDHIGRIIEHSIDCSVCDSVFKDDSREVVRHWKERFKVCPFCGAIMDGDGNGNL